MGPAIIVKYMNVVITSLSKCALAGLGGGHPSPQACCHHDKLDGCRKVVVRQVYGILPRPDLYHWTKISNEPSCWQHTQSAIIGGKGTSDMTAIDILHDDKINVDRC